MSDTDEDSEIPEESRESETAEAEEETFPAQRRAYTESEVIMSTVRVVTPFVLTFGLYITFHGADSPGGGFQGGALVGVVVLMLAFAFGIDPTRRWLGTKAVTLVASLGLLVFAAIGLGSVVLGGAFLEYTRYPLEDAAKYGIEAVEIGGIALIVAGVIMGLFFLTAAGPGGDVE
ncbi:cation:proton antiporter [Natronomonas sp. CBA1123]|uniref:MnhB domain-containing protein n=1 Tax=Natronomonas sp. CBA1123 TaxID=2668070 RepID=UPI0012E9EB11|nr:MnhB domain-containing protein [Natronomonas sp. CBA1123]MUV86621.1 cation:proton antiporter [Natronomonas sp. CBA1123]